MASVAPVIVISHGTRSELTLIRARVSSCNRRIVAPLGPITAPALDDSHSTTTRGGLTNPSTTCLALRMALSGPVIVMVALTLGPVFSTLMRAPVSSWILLMVAPCGPMTAPGHAHRTEKASSR